MTGGSTGTPGRIFGDPRRLHIEGDVRCDARAGFRDPAARGRGAGGSGKGAKVGPASGLRASTRK